MDNDLLARLLVKVHPRISTRGDHRSGHVRFEVGPNMVEGQTLDEAAEWLLDQALEHYGDWGERWEKDNG